MIRVIGTILSYPALTSGMYIGLFAEFLHFGPKNKIEHWYSKLVFFERQDPNLPEKDTRIKMTNACGCLSLLKVGDQKCVPYVTNNKTAVQN